MSGTRTSCASSTAFAFEGSRTTGGFADPPSLTRARRHAGQDLLRLAALSLLAVGRWVFSYPGDPRVAAPGGRPPSRGRPLPQRAGPQPLRAESFVPYRRIKIARPPGAGAKP